MRAKPQGEKHEIRLEIQSSEWLATMIWETVADIIRLKWRGKTQKLKGMISGLVASTIDQTLLYIEENAQESEKEFEKLFLWLNIWVWLSSLSERKIVLVNPCFCEIFEIWPEDAAWHRIDDFIARFVADFEQYQKWKQQFTDNGAVSSFELPLVTAKWNKRWILISSKRFTEADREAFSIMDVTNIKELEKLKEYTAHVLTHDIRSPLTGAIWFANLLNRKIKLKWDNAIYMYHIITSLQRLERLVNNYLDIMKMEQWIYNMNLETIDLREFLEKESSYFNISEKEKWVKIILPKKTRNKSIVLWDRNWLEHMFNNLLRNAIEETFKNWWDSARIEICDIWNSYEILFLNPGRISDELQPKLFKEKYLKSSKENGNWIWAYFANLIAKAHLGSIAIKGTDEKTWTVISVILPKNLLESSENKLDL
ncbi:MAG: Sensor protein [uncultured bacterium (gcode 4)]|uniref:histidine kinase n=1 Tax=uncultured bacterium (gcode 4) TaxID=1234023 RepID=K2G6C5_9BACT|nr:MAG: Sensor protein [uncultured bacterium (gcode 4)]